MKVVSYLWRTSKREIMIVAGTAFAGGIASAALVGVVNASLHHSSHRALLAGGFLLILLTKVSSSVVSNRLLVRLSQNTVLRVCDELCRRVARTPYRRLEDIGSARILACLTDDVNALSNAIQALPPLMVNGAVLVGCGLYLTWISWVASLALLAIVAVGALSYSRLLRHTYVAVRLAREGRDTLFRHFRTLTDGIKELKLNRTRRETFLGEDVGGAISYLRDQNIVAMNLQATADAWSQTVFYSVLGLLLFALPAMAGLSLEALTAYVFTALYIGAPIGGIIGGMPVFARGQEALERLDGLGLMLGEHQEAPPTFTIERTAPAVSFKDVRFSYLDGSSGRTFELGPLNMELGPGELVFVIGGNGSGKSTFVKLLTGLYVPDSGTIAMNNVPVGRDSDTWYREHFSTVYSDFFLFDRVHGPGGAELTAGTQQYLSSLQLEHKVRLEGDRFSTTALSQGQRRRLALLSAYVEDRPIYVLDEWAADQDPAFRKIFYTELLPELKRRGKTIVVVTHDDRYFSQGDRIIKLEYGKMVEYESVPISRRAVAEWPTVRRQT